MKQEYSFEVDEFMACAKPSNEVRNRGAREALRIVQECYGNFGMVSAQQEPMIARQHLLVMLTVAFQRGWQRDDA